MTDYNPIYKSGAPPPIDLVDEAPQDTLPECNRNDGEDLPDIGLRTIRGP